MDARKQLSAAAVFPFSFNRNVGAPGRKFMRKKNKIIVVVVVFWGFVLIKEF
jgi:hypothetical protein